MLQVPTAPTAPACALVTVLFLWQLFAASLGAPSWIPVLARRDLESGA